MAELALQGVSKTFSGHAAAVQDLDLTIQDQELVVLVGPSGCGKTTTLRLIAGLDDLSHGVMRINGQVVNQVVPRERNIAMVFQHSALYPHLSVYDNIAFGLRMRHGSSWFRRWWMRIWRPADDCRPLQRQAIGKAVRQASQALGLAHLLDRKPRELSGGERQRVALGRAIVRQPAAFLFDEPLSHLDPQQRVEMRQVIKRLQQQLGATMLYVTHDQAEAMELGNRIAVMNRGRIQQLGTPREVYERPADRFVARFMGEPAMNLIRGRLEWHRGSEGRIADFVGGGLAVKLVDLPDRVRQTDAGAREVELGVRPEHVQIVLSSADGDARQVVRGLEEEKQQVREHARQHGCCGRGRVTSSVMLGAMTVMTVAVATRATASDRAGASEGVETSDNVDASAADARGTSELTAVLPTAAAVEVGTQVAIAIDTTRVHWFDRETGKNLLGAVTSGGASTELPAPDCEP